MTVIAWDGKALAADRRAVNCGLARTVCKIERVKGALVGMSGDHGVAAEMLKWFTSGGEFPAKARDDIATLMVVDHIGVCLYTTGPEPMRVLDNHMAIGSGRDYALMAMHLGKTAKEAVELACLFEINCGNGVDVLEFES